MKLREMVLAVTLLVLATALTAPQAPAEAGEEETYVGVDEDIMQAVFQKFRELHKDELGE